MEENIELIKIDFDEATKGKYWWPISSQKNETSKEFDNLSSPKEKHIIKNNSVLQENVNKNVGICIDCKHFDNVKGLCTLPYTNSSYKSKCLFFITN